MENSNNLQSLSSKEKMIIRELIGDIKSEKEWEAIKTFIDKNWKTYFLIHQANKETINNIINELEEIKF